MDLVPAREEARIHRTVYIATLRSALKGKETHREFAARIGRTREYLQYLLQESDPRTPGPETAQRIAQALPLPAVQREDLLEQMLLAAERRLRAWRAARLSTPAVFPADSMERLRSAHWAATYAREPAWAWPHYQLVSDVAAAYLRHDDLRRQPLFFVETCLLLHDVRCVFDRPASALFHARLAGAVMRGLEPADYRRGRERFDHLRINAIYAEAVTLTMLGLGLQAERLLRDAEAAAERSATARTFWLPRIYQCLLAALSGKPRFSLYKARELAQRAKTARDSQGDPLEPHLRLLVDAALARAYLQYGSDLSARQAFRLMQPAVESMEEAPLLGPLHRVIVLRTAASACRAVNRLDEWGNHVQRALAMATAAGLVAQVRMIEQEYGEAPGAVPLPRTPVLISGATEEPG